MTVVASDNTLASHKIETAHGTVHIASLAQIEAYDPWKQALARAFPDLRKDSRYYQIVEQTILQGFDYQYFLLEDKSGEVRAVQPFFLLAQDLIAGSGPFVQGTVRPIRKLFRRFLTLRTLMVGCAAGEGHLDSSDPEQRAWIAATLHEALRTYAKKARAPMVVLKEFPSTYRRPLECFARNGYTRIPSLPMTRLSIDYASFEDYMTKALSKVTRKGLRRKFKATADANIELQVVEDVTPFVDEVHALYMNVYNRSKMHFEKLTKEYMCRLGQEMPDKVRFFLWRQNGKIIAFSLTMLQGDSIYDEYLGLDYSVALDLHLYFYTLRDIIEWSIQHGLKWYCSSALNYDPKLHLKSDLAPLDLYVAHTSKIANFILSRVLPWMEPTRGDKILKEFKTYDRLWGDE
jgi:hypothetical protein